MQAEVYGELVQRSTSDVQSANYARLLEACSKTLEEVPNSVEQLDTLDMEDTLGNVIERFVGVITSVVPFQELENYIPRQVIRK